MDLLVDLITHAIYTLEVEPYEEPEDSKENNQHQSY